MLGKDWGYLCANIVRYILISKMSLVCLCPILLSLIKWSNNKNILGQRIEAKRQAWGHKTLDIKGSCYIESKAYITPLIYNSNIRPSL